MSSGIQSEPTPGSSSSEGPSSNSKAPAATTRRPKDTKFKQQRLPAWQPVMSANSVLPILFAVGIAFIPLGVAFLITSNNVQEIIVDYTNCNNCGTQLMNTSSQVSCQCNVSFQLPQQFPANVYMYYGLTNFYQNHRRYVKSYDAYQLEGTHMTYNSLDSNCNPYMGVNNSISYAPCGAIANSMFNDTLQIFYNNGTGEPLPVGLLNTGIAWSTDINVKYKNPPGGNSATLQYAFNNTLPPPNWGKPVYDLDLDNLNNSGYQNQDLMVWMRTAALPTFRKFYRRVNHTHPFQNGLPPGNYTLVVEYAYPVLQFNGQKRMILTTTSFLGGKNPFLGIAYIVVGSICILAGFMFLIIHIKVGKRGRDILTSNLNNRTPYYETPRSGVSNALF